MTGTGLEFNRSMQERTACVNRIRGMLTEFGLVVSRSPEKLREKLTDLLEDASNDLSGLARLVIEEASGHWKEIDATHQMVR